MTHQSLTTALLEGVRKNTQQKLINFKESELQTSFLKEYELQICRKYPLQNEKSPQYTISVASQDQEGVCRSVVYVILGGFLYSDSCYII